MGQITNQYFFMPACTSANCINIHGFPHFHPLISISIVESPGRIHHTLAFAWWSFFPFLWRTSPRPQRSLPLLPKMETKDFFDGLPWGDDVWEDADMVSCLAYVRGNRDLNIGEWRDSFPEALWPYVTISYGGDAISSNKHVALATFLP